MSKVPTTILAGVLLGMGAWGSAQSEIAQPGQTAPAHISRTIVFPVLVQAPLFGASVDLPSVNLPSGGGSTRPSGSTDSSLNGAAFAGLRIDRDRWMLEVDGLYAGLSSERTLPRITIDTHVKGGTATFGWRVSRDLLVTAAVRRMGLKITAAVEGFDSLERKPGVWDPLLGVMWRHEAGRNWTLEADFQGGGFGVGTDVDLARTST